MEASEGGDVKASIAQFTEIHASQISGAFQLFYMLLVHLWIGRVSPSHDKGSLYSGF